MSSSKIAWQLATAKEERLYLEAPAGCGKTHLIAEAVALADNGVQLILTHTHAGVASIKSNLKKRGVSPRNYKVDTIDGWARRLASNYPQASGVHEDMSWTSIRQAALKVFDHTFLRTVILASYRGLYVDEYQDCSLSQHAIIMKLSEYLPCRIFGDPLQSIFDFDKEDKTIDWDRDVEKNFDALPPLSTPWRWLGDKGNPKLGEWLFEIRKEIQTGDSIDLSTAPLNHIEYTNDGDKIKACKSRVNAPGTIVVIEKFNHRAHGLANKLGGLYQSMEEIECKDLRAFAEKISVIEGGERAQIVIGYAKRVLTKISGHLLPLEKKIKAGKSPYYSGKKLGIKTAASSLQKIFESNDVRVVKSVLEELRNLDGVRISRRELWNETMKSFELFDPTTHESLLDAVTKVRDQTRITGRTPERRLISRVLLIKGLQFEHAIVMDAEQFTGKELYVALTRGSSSLTVLSKSSVITPKPSETKKSTEKILKSKQLSLFEQL